MNYLIVNMKDEYFICAEKRLPEIARRYNCEKPKKLYQFQGSALLDIIANEPIFNRDLQILADNGVSDKFGSGINALIPAHDFKSEKICAKNKITMRGYVDNQGKFTNDLGISFKGVDCFTEGGNRIIKKLQKKNSLFLQWDYETTVFFNNKTQETLLLMSIPCFFMKISNKIKLDSLKELAFVKFAPELDFFEEKDETLKYQPQKRRRSLKEKESSTYDNVIEALSNY